MRVLAGLGLSLWTAFAGAAMANENPVVVELFTSQGCSSCPPADAMLHELADRDNVIALALHVDYWDYIGWADTFASPENSDRQRRYAAAVGARSIFTPQLVVNGQDHVIGAKAMQLADAINAHLQRDTGVRVQISRDGGQLQILCDAEEEQPGSYEVRVIRYTPSATVDIRRGENAGRSITYSHIVTSMQVVGTWDGQDPMRGTYEIDGTDPVVVLLQVPNGGPIVASAVLR